MRTKQHLTFAVPLLLTFLFTNCGKEASPISLDDHDLTTCAPELTCTYIYADGADLADGLRIKAGAARVFTYRSDGGGQETS